MFINLRIQQGGRVERGLQLEYNNRRCPLHDV